MVSASVIAWRRQTSTSRKSFSTAAGSISRCRSFSSTKGRFSRTKFKSSIESTNVSEKRRGMHASMTGTKPSVLVALGVTLCPLWFMTLGHFDRKMMRKLSEYVYLHQSAQSDAKRQEVHPCSQPDQKRMPARHKRVPNPVQFSNDNVEIQPQIRVIQLREHG